MTEELAKEHSSDDKRKINSDRKSDKGKEEDVRPSPDAENNVAEEAVNVGPRFVPEFDLDDVNDNGNCFYEAAGLQLELIQHPYLARLALPEGTDLHDSLRLSVQGENFNDREWADYEEIWRLAEITNSVMAIIDTRHPELGFQCYFSDNFGQRQRTHHVTEVTVKPVIRLAYTGDHYLSVSSHPRLGQGGLREEFHGEALGCASDSVSAVRLSQSRYTALSSHSGRLSASSSRSYSSSMQVTSTTVSSRIESATSKSATGMR